MVTCYLTYVIDPYKLKDFEFYAYSWIPLVKKFGGQHHGYFLPHEGANNIAVALFSFETLAAYEKYRMDSFKDEQCQKLYQFATESKCIISFNRSFMNPIFK